MDNNAINERCEHNKFSFNFLFSMVLVKYSESCTISWLSKVESGISTPAPWLFELLMNRLGKSTEPFINLRTDFYMLMLNLKCEIGGLWRSNQLDEGKKKLDIFNTMRDHHNLIDKQFALLYQAVFYRNEMDVVSELKLLEEALRVTQPKFNYNALDKLLLTMEEIVILNNIAAIKEKYENVEKALDLWKTLVKIAEFPKYTESSKRIIYATLCSNLAGTLRLLGQNIECINYCDKGITFCVKNNVLRTFSKLLYNKAWSLALLGNRNESVNLFKQSYHIYSVIGNSELAKKYINKAEVTFSIIVI